MLQAFSGMMAMTGERDGGRSAPARRLSTMATGMLAFSGVSARSMHASPARQPASTSACRLLETAIALLGYHIPAYTLAGKLPPRDGSACGTSCLSGFASQDGYVLAGATNDAAWQRLCAAIGAADLRPTRLTPPRHFASKIATGHRGARHDIRHPQDEAWVGLLDAANVRVRRSTHRPGAGASAGRGDADGAGCRPPGRAARCGWRAFAQSVGHAGETEWCAAIIGRAYRQHSQETNSPRDDQIATLRKKDV